MQFLKTFAGLALLGVAGCSLFQSEDSSLVEADNGLSSREASAGEEVSISPGEARRTIEEAHRLAIDFILNTQKDDGGWGHYLPSRRSDILIGGVNSLHAFGNTSSALCCMALMQAEPSTEVDEALVKGIRYLVVAPRTHRIDGAVFYNPWAHGYMTQALSLALDDPRCASMQTAIRERCMEEIEGLWRTQSLNGGWGYYDFRYKSFPPSGMIATPFTTAAALGGLKQAKLAGIPVDQKRIDFALFFMEQCRSRARTYIYSWSHAKRPYGTANDMRGSIGRNQSGDYTLVSWDKIDRDQIEMALDDFFYHHDFIECGRGRQYPHEAWYATAPYYYLFGHYYAACNLDYLPDDKRAEYATKLGEIIVDIQEDDGAIWDYPLYNYTKAYGTGYGALILGHCLGR